MTCPAPVVDSPVPIGIQPVPCDFVAATATTFQVFQIVIGIAALGVVAYMVREAVRTRSPLPIWLLISSLMLAWYAEPLGDIMGGIYIAREAVWRMFTVAGRPMPVADICVWVFLALSTYVLYRMMLSGASLRRMLIVSAAIGIAEVAGEALFVKLGMMLYYSNHALVLGLPIYSWVQNAMLSLAQAAVLVVTMPHIRGVRWLVFLFWMPCVMMAYLIGTTIPGYIGIHQYADISPLVGWLLALTAAGLNVLGALVLVNMDKVRALRESPSLVPAEEPIAA